MSLVESNPFIKDVERLENSMQLFKEIITIIMAIAFTNAITFFIYDVSNNTIRNFGAVSLPDVIIFLVIITTLIRFFHGNVRHLVEDYSRERIIEEHRSGVELSIDFFFILLQSVIFVLMSFYISGGVNSFRVIYDLTIILLGVDILWFILMALSRRILSWQHAAARWTIVNIITIFVLLVLRNQLFNTLNIETSTEIFGVILFANMFLDYGINWPFYFPRPFRKGLTVFFAGPFTSKLIDDETSETGKIIEPKYRELLQYIFRKLRSHNFEVLSAFEAEDWGRKSFEPEKIAIRDYNDVLSSDVLVVYLDGTETEGIFIEMGWATAFRRYLLIIIPEEFEEEFNRKISPVVKGLRILARDYQIIKYKDKEELVRNLISQLNSVLVHGKFL